MKIRRHYSRHFLSFAASLACALSALGGPAADVGHPIVQIVTPREYRAHPLCQAVIQGADGFLYVANNTDALAYDGAAWRSIKLPAESAGIRRFALGADGTLYAGGDGVLGRIVERDGEMIYESLAEKLPADERRWVRDISDAAAVQDAVCFAAPGRLFVWRGGRFSVVHLSAAAAEAEPLALHRLGAELYCTARGAPLCRWDGDRLTVASTDPLFRDASIVELALAADGARTVFTMEQGCFTLDADGRATPLATPFDPFLRGRRLTQVERLRDGAVAFAFAPSSGRGGIVLDPAGKVLTRLDASIGLTNDAVRSLACDREGGLWLGLESGLARLEWPPAVTLFDAVNGLGHAFVDDTVVHDGERYAALIDGLYRLTPRSARGDPARFVRVLERPVYSLLSHPGGLLVRGYTEIYAGAGERFSRVAKSPAGMGPLYRSRRDPRRVWFTSSAGVHSLYRTEDGWRDEGLIPNFDYFANGTVELADGTLVVETHSRGRYHLIFDGPAGPDRGVPRIERFDAKAKHYVALDPAAPRDSDPDPRSPLLDERDDDWGTNNHADATQRTVVHSSPRRTDEILPHLLAETSGMIWRLRHEPSPDGDLLWICGANGLVRAELARLTRTTAPLTVVLRAARPAEGQQLDYGQDPVAFEFAAPRFRPGGAVVYQTRLAGYDDRWSEWSATVRRSFTHLPSGSYRFEVRARDTDGALSAVASRAFSVLPPGWLRWWAWSGYAVTAGGLLVAAVQWRTRRLRQEKVRLEELVAERTAALAARNSELARLHKLELDAKISARLGEEKARLEVLRYQLNPHFLFNVLASIHAQVPPTGAGAVARDALSRLVEFCRLTLDGGGSEERGTVRDEFELLRVYLEIERARSAELFELEFSLDAAAAAAPMPRLLLLPLVENALKYGRATTRDRLRLRLAATRDAATGELAIEIANTGEWVDDPGARGLPTMGIGLENLTQRLRRYFGDTASLSHVARDGWVCFQLRLPPPAS